MANRLDQASSPYLRQHADNPVHWQEWSDRVWQNARSQNKPVFLSVGYSSCHWCHVMAHESFEDPEVAEALNRHFVCVKLDREERPDIDDVYMTAVQLASGHGGWPMTVFLTPDQKPFFAGTYFPKIPRQGVPSFLQLVTGLAHAWQNDRQQVLETADKFSEGLRQVLERAIPPVTEKITPGILDQALQTFHNEFDDENGGFGSRPKFPPHAALTFLLSYAANRDQLPGDPRQIEALAADAAHMALRSLEAIALGGIHDHVGGGFHRYSTDEHWLLPHFEKMLYDNAQLLAAFSLAADIASEPSLADLYRQAANQTVAWLDREMTDPQGLFYSALDADTDHEEGLTYTWTAEEIRQTVADPESLLALYQFQEAGNFHDEATGQLTGRNIPHLVERTLRDPRLDDLLAARNLRPQPGLDDKRLLSWNALMVSALAKAGHLTRAARCADAWLALAQNHPEKHLPHQVATDPKTQNPTPSGLAFLDGYAYFADALLDLAEATGKDHYRAAAHQIAHQMVDLFADPRGAFFYTSRQHETLLGRQKPSLDNATPSPNGVALRVLRRLGHTQEALRHLTAVYGWAQRLPSACGTLLLECLHHLVAAGDDLPTPAQSSQPTLTATLHPQNPTTDPDGNAHATLTIHIPPGYHVNSTDPGADWLTPTTIRVEGPNAEAGFPVTDTGSYEGDLEIQLRLRPTKTLPQPFTITIQAQLCNDSECLRPQTLTLQSKLSP